jgi:hypothetical protein
MSGKLSTIYRTALFKESNMKSLTHIYQAIANFTGRCKAKNIVSLLLMFSVATAILFFAQHKTSAVTITWDGGGTDNLWSNRFNWSGDAVPASGDAVIFDGTSVKDATVDINATVNTLNINGGYTGAITIANGVTFNPGSATIAGGTFNVGGGTFNPGGSFPLNGGTLNGNTGTINVNFQMGINGNATFNGNSCTLNTQSLALNSGTFNSTSGNWTVDGFALNGGTFDLDNGTITFVGGTNADITGPGSLTLNNVVINKNSNSTQLNFPSGTNVIQGTLTLTEGLIGGGTLKAQGAINIAATFGDQNINTAGGGSGTILIQDGASPRTITIAAGAFLPTMQINDANATINTSGTGTINTERLTLQAGAVDIGSNNFTVGYNVNGGGRFIQSGGTFSIGSGNFTLNSSSTFTLNSGTFTAASGNLSLGPTGFNATQINGGTFNAPSGTTTCHSFIASGGTFNANGTLIVRGNFVHSAGVFNPNNSSVIFRFNGNNPLEISCPAGGTNFNNLTFFDVDMVINAGMPVVNGTFTHNAGFINSGQIHIKGNMVVQPQASGGTASLVFNGTGNQTFTNNGGQNLSGAWTVNKPSGAVTLASNLILGTSQALNITSGRLDLGPSFNLTAGAITIGASGTLRNFGAGNLTLGGNLINNGIFNFNGGGTACGDPTPGDPLLIRSSSAGAARNWSGPGAFSIVDSDIQDQNATAIVGGVTANTSTNSGNNTNFNFSASCPVEVTSQPTNQTACPGTSTTFTAAASGTGLTFQWRKNGVNLTDGGNISGATTSMLTINPVGASDVASYDVVATNTFGVTATSSPATFTLLIPPAINGQPSSAVRCVGEPVTFSVSAIGTGLTFQWRKDGNDINGATTSSFTIMSVTTGDAGSYDCVVSGVCPPAVTSLAVSLTINTPPNMTQQPSGATKCVGESATFTVAATGTGLTFQWRKDGNNIAGATANSFTINPVTTDDAGNYDCVVSGVCPPAVTSNAVTLTVNTPPAIDNQPTDATKCVGESVTFSVSATGTALTFQWRKAGANVAGATSSNFTIGSVTTDDAGSYDCVISGACSPSATSNAVTLTVNTPPNINNQPSSATKCVGESVTFTVAATGTSLTFQWRKESNTIDGATASSFTIASVNTGDAASYDCVISGVCSPTATSNAVTLTVNTPPNISTQPTNQTVCDGTSASFSVAATGTGIGFQWRKNGVNLSDGSNISGATTATLTINPASAADADSYDVVITGTCAPSATSNAVTLIVNGFALSAASQFFPMVGGSGSVNVITDAACSWTAASHDSFITITSGSNGTGNGTVNFTVSATSTPRTGTLTIAGLTFTINQTNPTAVTLQSFTARSFDHGTLLEWQTGYEAGNLGFNLYREANGKREPVNPQLIAGSALRASSRLLAGESYGWWDISAIQNGVYWLEDLDLAGKSTWHGPVYARTIGSKPASHSHAALISKLGSEQPMAATSRPLEPLAQLPTSATARQLADQLNLQSGQTPLSSQPAVKISINRQGLYRLTQPQLVAAGLSETVDPRLLQLFVDDREIPITVLTGKDGRFDQSSFIEFYGLGLDTPSTDRRTYWLVEGKPAGRRIRTVEAEGVSSSSQSFTHTIERRDRSIYFSSLRNGERENFFGAVITSSGVEQTIFLSHVHPSTSLLATIEIVLQGVAELPHRVAVQLGGQTLGEIAFAGQQLGSGRFSVPHSQLNEGANTIRLTSLNGQGDVNLVERIRLSYEHQWVADDEALQLTVTGKERIKIGGFMSKAIRVFDVTDEDDVKQLSGDIEPEKTGAYQISFAAGESGERRILALTDAKLKSAASVQANQPSNWQAKKNAADLVIVTRREFFAELEAFAMVRESEGLRVKLIDVEDLYDEFSFGHKTPQALRDFFAYAQAHWKVAPRYALFAGDASFDARNYLGFGDNDLVPTKLIDTELMETATDEWFADFNDDGISELAVGRLPMRTAQEATTLVAKILDYENKPALPSALLVSDVNDGFDFEGASGQLREFLPSSMRVEALKRGQLDAATAKARLLDSLASGQTLVNYTGHGSVNLWRGNLLTAEEARRLENKQLPVFVMMTCLNSYFDDAALDSLAEGLLKSDRGGAVAVWSSSGMTMPATQALMNQALYSALFLQSNNATKSGQGERLGEAIQRAKASVRDTDIRRTWILLGDPTLRLR